MSGSEAATAAEEWRHWSEVAAADLADPVDGVEAEQAAWEAESGL